MDATVGMQLLLASLVALLLYAPSRISAETPQDQQWNPLQLSVVPSMQLVDRTESIRGIRLSLFSGSNRNMYGLDVGLLNFTQSSSGGIGLGAANWTYDHYGMQLGILNRAKRAWGIQAGLINISKYELSGLQFGLANAGNTAYPMFGLVWNYGAGDLYSGQYSLGVNYGAGEFVPLQISGLASVAKRGSGLQISGVVNASGGNGVHVAGLVNYSQDRRGPVPTALAIAGLFNYDEQAHFQLTAGANISEKAAVQNGGIFNKNKVGWWQLAGAVNVSSSSAIQLAGLSNSANRSMIQFAALLNVGDSVDYQIGVVANRASGSIFQLAFLNQSNEVAAQLGIFNASEQKARMQFGLLNQGESIETVQFGLINDTVELHGLQIGLLNIARKSAFPVTLLFHSSFEPMEEAPSGLLAANWTPVQFALYTPAQLFSATTPVWGLYLNGFYGASDTATGLNLGFANRADTMIGVRANLFAYSERFDGLSVSLASSSDEIMRGIAVSALFYQSGETRGLAIAPIAITEGNVLGLQMGLWNSGENVGLPQFGLVNLAKATPGQFGIFNQTAQSNYAQIGFLNRQRGNMETAIQIAGLVNLSQSPAELQSAGLINSGTGTPLQISGIVNVCQDACSIQVSGLVNGINSSDYSDRSDYNLVQTSLLWNHAAGTSFQLGAFNDAKDARLQIGFLNLAKKPGIQIGLLNGYGGDSPLRIGFINVNFLGPADAVHIGAINLRGNGDGLMVGAWNIGRKNNGLMVGLFNYSNDNNGIQIGLINVDAASDVPILPGLHF